jgi:hypothetical protein
MDNTLTAPAKLTLQEVFDKVWNTFKGGDFGWSKVSCSGDCRYRTPDGLKCAAGIFIPDSIYRPEMENSVLSIILNRYPDLRSYLQTLMDDNSIDKLTYLQRVHDDSARAKYNGRDWLQRFANGMAELAKSWGLSFAG